MLSAYLKCESLSNEGYAIYISQSNNYAFFGLLLDEKFLLTRGGKGTLDHLLSSLALVINIWIRYYVDFDYYCT